MGNKAGALLAGRLLLALLCVVRNGAAMSGPSDTWAVIISSSRFWLNYRHSSNALGVYQAVRRLGIPDSRIILMLAEQPACSPRNVHPGQLYLAPGAGAAAGGSSGAMLNLLSGDAEVDYRGREVSVDSVLRVLTGRHPPGTPASKRLRSGPASRVLLYLTGHGGDEFLKFHDEEELLAADIAGAVHQMAAAGRYGELLLVADTCQASTLYGRIAAAAAPNVLAVASSKLGQSSYAHHIDPVVGQHVVDQLSFHLHQFLSGSGPGPSPSLQQLLDYLGAQRLSSEVQVRTDLSPRHPARVAVTDFFGAAMPGAPAAGGASPAPVGCVGAGAEGSRAAAALLQLAAQQQRGHGTAAAARQGQQQCWHQHQHRQQLLPLWQQLEAAGGSSDAASWLVAGRGTEAAVVAAAWAIAVVLLRVLLQY
ncbi:hypothetical protein CHLNCDRAFT_34727 [Chlorella variabilis]|uniref:GPI-anchor transamidase n=1 Tax=Chlorella variabilis TaxID=554065 RepID=E1Z9C4_CHLVA|nr:hypothetical protein CHLNCDRAFT_34727 [Chlorella variabilis]EFN57492.1 hypothetical protein CHLNCDRAFT_34727 [Chlorella variabilis]|eukprot:XP_005849594.1 hypothetical protein CHLNCDRAFT_34727 [Chlorella variabilis]